MQLVDSQRFRASIFIVIDVILPDIYPMSLLAPLSVQNADSETAAPLGGAPSL